MKPNDHHDREPLSALFDGELSGEARLFAMRRLSHDADWQAQSGRWQLIGDAMRRQAPIAAPGDFADRVSRSIAVPVGLAAAPAVAGVATPARRPYRVWAGGALAASVALAAVLAIRAPTPQASTPAVAAVPSPASTAAAPPPPAVVSLPVPVATPRAEPQLAAVSDAPATAEPVERTSTRSAASRPTRVRPASAAAVAAVAPPPVAFPSDTNPFHVPPTNPLSTRPWPRASLGGAAGALTASYGGPGDSRGDSPSFFPFEPRVPAGVDGAADTP